MWRISRLQPDGCPAQLQTLSFFLLCFESRSVTSVERKETERQTHGCLPRWVPADVRRCAGHRQKCSTSKGHGKGGASRLGQCRRVPRNLPRQVGEARGHVVARLEEQEEGAYFLSSRPRVLLTRISTLQRPPSSSLFHSHPSPGAHLGEHGGPLPDREPEEQDARGGDDGRLTENEHAGVEEGEKRDDARDRLSAKGDHQMLTGDSQEDATQ